MKQRHRPMSINTSRVNDLWRWLFYTVGVIFLVGFIFLILYGTKYSESINLELGSTMKTTTLANAITESQESLKNKDSEIKEKIDKLSEINKSSNDIIAEASKLNDDIVQLQSIVAEQKDSIVTVARYAPGSQGNQYAPGYCTYYVKQMRPDLPNDLGNANQWYSNAKAEGYKVGSKPKVGAVGVSYEGWAGHVVYVQKLKKNGNVVISEMNYMGLWNKNTREVSPSSFVYIYSL